MIAAELKYRKTGIDWMPEVPEHWEIVRLKHVTKILSGATPKTSVSANWDGNINWVTPAEFGDEMYIGESVRKITKTGLQSCAASLVPIGSIILSNRAPIGSLGISKVELSTNQGCKSIIPTQINNYFLYFLMTLQKENLNVLGNGTTFRELATPSLRNYKIPLPPKEEQDIIAKHLFDENEKITHFIQTKQRFIELLKEQRQSIITNAVTKGIDDGVKMKETVLGEIPEHWEVRRLKFCITEKLRYGANASGDYYNPSWYRYIRITDFTPEGTLDENNKLSLSPENGKDYELKDGDILLARSGATVGKSFQFCSVDRNERCCYAGYLIKASPNEEIILSDFLYNYTLSSNYENWKNSIFIKATIENISADKYANLLVTLPPINEQKRILEHIKTETKTLDIAISKAEREIELIKEYREAMIAEAVTGKMKL
jgi:type I restriction enzyme S subunit